MTYKEACEKGSATLEKSGVPEAALDARLLLEHVCGTDRNFLLVHGDSVLELEKQTAYFALVEKRSRRIPLQQLTGVQYFMGLPFQLDKNVLIPRQDTEILVEEVLRNLHDGMRVLDMCTGSGCILISLLHYTNDCQGIGVDISPDALKVAEKNARLLLKEDPSPQPDDSGYEPEEARRQLQVSFVESDLFEKVDGMFDLIVSNPPYIPSGEINGLMPEVRDHEPRLALDGSDDGLLFYRRIIDGCKDHLTKGGMLFFEIGYTQGEAVSRMMEQAGFLELHIKKDYAGLDRVVFGTLGFEP